MSPESLDDQLDRIVSEYSDRAAAGERLARAAYLEQVTPEARPGLERCLKMIDAGMACAPPANRPLTAGQTFGRYELLREVGRGGMALVWLAKDPELKRPVALKILRPGLALEERHVSRFKREAQSIARLSHPHIVQVFEVGEEQGYHFLAMEYIEGPSFETVLDALAGAKRQRGEEIVQATGIARLAQGNETFEQAMCRLLAPIADALHEAHAHGLVHRDVKPSNILLRSDGRAMIADFGLAKADGDPALSMSGETLGTPYYMSPEQAWLSSHEVDHRTDVYSLGVTLYESLTGTRPFEGATVLEVFEAIKTRVPTNLRSLSPHASRDVGAVCRMAMSRFANDRYNDSAALRDELLAIADGRTTLARRDEGGLFKRTSMHARLYFSSQPYEYRSERRFLGLPLVHIISGRRYPGQSVRVAKGWFAAGDIAIGGIACGGMAFGGVACGGIAAGVFAWGGVAAALLISFGGLAFGGMPMGGIALGYMAYGGIAMGYAAMGGLARGVYAFGGDAKGTYAISQTRHDPEAEIWFQESAPWHWTWWNPFTGL